MDKNKHLAPLDGIRAIAILTVLLSHYSNETEFLQRAFGRGAGQVGVMVFFVLSGFLMAHLNFRKTPSSSAVFGFFRARIARVFPLFYLAIAASLLMYIMTGVPLEGISVTPENLLQNVLFIEGSGLLWTLAVEVQFYLLFPLVWVAYARYGIRTILWGAVISITLMLLVKNISLGFDALPIFHYSPYFFIGIGLSVLRNSKQVILPGWTFVASLIAYVMILPMVRTVLFGVERGRAWNDIEYPLVIAALLVTALTSPLGQRMMSGHALRWTAKVSYSAYIWHLPILVWVAGSHFGASHALSIPTFLVATAAVSHFSYTLFERPARDFINNRKMPPQAQLP